MAATRSLQQIFSLKSSGDGNDRLFKCTGSAATGVSKGAIICVADLGFSRSSFGNLKVFKTSNAVLGLGSAVRPLVRASVLAGPALDVVRVCVFYALVQTGIAVPSPILRGTLDGVDDSSRPKWLESLFGKDEEAEKDKNIIKLRRNWRTSIKGTLTRKYRASSKQEGLRILNSICSLLSDDDDFVELGTHKGCAIRRENAHAESVCCNNVRALFDELPTPHLVVEITVFPKGPITDVHWQKAAKLEQVLKRGNSI
jgi:hypothetical protein